MPSKPVEKFLNSTMSSIGLTSAIYTKFLAIFAKSQGILYDSYTRKIPWFKWCQHCKGQEWYERQGCSNCSGHSRIYLSREEVSEIKNNFSNLTVREWLKAEGVNNRHYDGKKADCIGKFFLNIGFGYLCWGRIGTKARAQIFQKAVGDMGKDFVLSMPAAALPAISSDRSHWHLIRSGTIRTLIEGYVPSERPQYGPSFERSIRVLQEAGFTKDDGAIFDLDLKTESEADKLRAKHPKLSQRNAKLFLEIAKAEGWVK